MVMPRPICSCASTGSSDDNNKQRPYERERLPAHVEELLCSLLLLPAGEYH